MDNKGNNNNGGSGNNGGNNKNGMTIMVFILAALVVLFLTSLLNSCARDATNKEITYSEFVKMVEEDRVAEVTFTSNRIKITPKGQDTSLYRITYYTAELRDEELLPLLKEHGVKFGGEVEDVSTTIMWNLVSYILPLVLVWVLLYFLIFRKMGGGGMMGVGKTTAKVYVEKSTGVTFKDVAGQDEAKESLQEVVDFLHNPKRYIDIGAKLPKGALLVGPPGTGKTLLAKAVAGEANVPFFSLAGSDFVEMFVGVGASRVRDLFKEAQKQAPCIIFIDEIDAIGKSRDTRYGGNDEREQTLNQLLAEMDGFDTSKGLLILAATNRPEVLDKALLRPGRFDRRIIVDKPDLKGRVETLKVHAKNVLMDETVDLDAIALATSGAVGSDLANMINEAAINAVKHGRKYVNQGDLFESVEVVIAGKEKKDRIMGPKEKKMVAYHEVGHALVTALQKDAEPVQKITIVPRTMGALGYTMQVPEEEKYLMTRNELTAHLVTYMGGRAAEEIVFESVTTGASNDIEQATKIARAMVTQYGMSEKFGLMGLVTVESQYLDGRATLNCGEETAAQIDQEVMRILKECYDTAIRLLQENRDILDEIAQYLYNHETITGKEFMKIFRKLKGIPEPEEKTDAEKAAEEFKAEESHPRRPWTGEPREESRPRRPWTGEPKGEDHPRRPWTGEPREEDHPRRPWTGESREEDHPRRPWTGEPKGEDHPRRPWNQEAGSEFVEMGTVPRPDPAEEQMLPMGEVAEGKEKPFHKSQPPAKEQILPVGETAEVEEKSFRGDPIPPERDLNRIGFEEGTQNTAQNAEEENVGSTGFQQGAADGKAAIDTDTPKAWQDIRRVIATRTKEKQESDAANLPKIVSQNQEEKKSQDTVQNAHVENLRDAFLVAAMQEEQGIALGQEGAASPGADKPKPGKQKENAPKRKNGSPKEPSKPSSPAKARKAQAKGKSQKKPVAAKESSEGEKGNLSEIEDPPKEIFSQLEGFSSQESPSGQGVPSGQGIPSGQGGSSGQGVPSGQGGPSPQGVPSGQGDSSSQEALSSSGAEDYLDRLLKGIEE